MRSLSAFLQALERVNVPCMFSCRVVSGGRKAHFDRRADPAAESHGRPVDFVIKSLKLRDQDPKVTRRKTAILRQHPGLLAALCGSVLLASCGLDGTDRDTDDKAPSAKVAEEAEAIGEVFEDVSIPDSEQRPTMQLQVVLDRQGFGPGVIDGRAGLSTANALKGFQEATGLEVTGEFDLATRGALARWEHVAATRVVRIPESWGRDRYRAVPEEPADQAKLDALGYASIDERLAERFHTTVEVLHALNPGGRPATTQSEAPAPGPSAPAGEVRPVFAAGQLVRVPNAGVDHVGAASGDSAEWRRTLTSLGVDGVQPDAALVVVDKSDSWLKAYDAGGKLIAMFTVTTGSGNDPLPLGEWGINGVARNPPFAYDPDLFWDVPDDEEEQHLPPGPNGPVGVVWIDLTREHYGIHGTPHPETIGRAQSHGCVRLTNWDAARLAGMVDGSTKVVFEA